MTVGRGRRGAATTDDQNRIDLAEWTDPEPVSKPERLDVTISVRFSAAEIASIRQRATAAGVGPTTYIRRCALAQADAPLDRRDVALAVEAVAREVERLRRATA